MTLLYIPCVPYDIHTRNPLMIGRIYPPSRFYDNSPRVLAYSSEAYESYAGGCNNGIPGKWVNCCLFIPPLGIFSSMEDAEYMLKIHNAAPL